MDYGDTIPGVSEEEMEKELALAWQGLAPARQKDPAGNLTEVIKTEVGLMETLYFPNKTFRPFAPHVLARFALAHFSRKLKNALVAYYTEHPGMLTTAF